MRQDETENKLANEIFVARQPIFTPNRKIYGYELLFRSNRDNYFDQAINQDFASSKTLVDSFISFGIKELTREKRAFINMTQNNLLEDYISAVPKREIVVELLETIEPDAEIIAICKKLKQNGYVIALDDFVFEPKYEPLIEVADIIKIDFMETLGIERQKVITDVGADHIKFLAEKVETMEEYTQAVQAGYSYFQGYFFSKPVILSQKDLPSFKPNLLMLLKELMAPNLSLKNVENIMKRDVSLSYKLLRFINSAAFGFYTGIKSIKHAINLIGMDEFKKWMSVIVLSQLGTDKPDELMRQSVVRAKLCELVCGLTTLKGRSPDAFLMGMFSLLDAIVGKEMEELMENLPLSDEIKKALLGEDGNFKDLLDLVVSYDMGDWDLVAVLTKKLGVNFNKMPECYFQALQWANFFATD
ncbi:MAG: HDOD domain-containing protein [bacterium]|nr:HDOD domain-containing protein [bacterium]